MTAWVFSQDTVMDLPAAERPARLGASIDAEFASQLSRLCATGAPTGDWLQWLAAETMLAHRCNFIQRDAIPACMLTARPLGPDAPTLGELLSAECAACVIPLTSPSGPHLAVIWAFRGLAISVENAPDGYARWITYTPSWGQIQIRLAHTHETVGHSWQLAASLAVRALDWPAERRLALARDWVVTGAVNGQAIEPVDMGHKLACPVGKRKWLIPMANRDAIGPTINRTIWAAASTVQADSIVQGAGFAQADMTELPVDIDTLHTFTSKARLPVLQVVLAMRPRNIVLWHSADPLSIQAAKDLSSILLPPLCSWQPAIESAHCPSDDLAEAERVLRSRLTVHAETPGIVVFAGTSGNFIMRLAASTVVTQNFPTIPFVYRDLQAPAERFTVVMAATVPPTTRNNVTGPISSRAGVNVEQLFRSDEGALSGQELLDTLRNA